jgi:hypothetical protein
MATTDGLYYFLYCRCGLLYDASKQCAVTVFWPVRSVRSGEVATCQRLPNGRAKLQAIQSAMAQLDADSATEDTGASLII